MKWWHNSWHSHGTGTNKWGFSFTLIHLGLVIEYDPHVHLFTLALGPFWLFINTK